MNPEQDNIIHTGLHLIATQPVLQNDPDNTTAALLDEMQQYLRAPEASNFLIILSRYPEYLEQLWQHFAPVLARNSFEQEADSLREKSLLETVPGVARVNPETGGETDRLRAYVDTCFYALPKVLLLATLFQEATFGTVPDRRDRVQATDQALPPGMAPGTLQVSPIHEQDVSEQLQQLFESILKQHQQSLLPHFYRGLGHWPDFLNNAWQELMPLVGTPDYENLKEYLVYQAQMSLRKLPVFKPALTQLPAEQKEEIRAILSAYRYKILPETLIDTALIKAMLDGPAEAYTSAFSLTASDEPDEDPLSSNEDA